MTLKKERIGNKAREVKDRKEKKTIKHIKKVNHKKNIFWHIQMMNWL